MELYISISILIEYIEHKGCKFTGISKGKELLVYLGESLKKNIYKYISSSKCFSVYKFSLNTGYWLSKELILLNDLNLLEKMKLYKLMILSPNN